MRNSVALGRCGHGTHVGKVRPHNEDSYLVDAEFGFSVLADGMGGHEGGEIASQIVANSVSADIHDGKMMVDALVNAHNAVLYAAKNGGGRLGMGSTAVAIRLDEESFEIAWVGDSRAYCWDGEQLIQITKDHSLVQQMIDEGSITAEEASTHPRRNYITQSMGMPESQELSVGQIEGRLYSGYQFLLCSDGLTDEVTHSEISGILGLDLDEQQKADRLIQRAVDNGGADNITVVLFSAPDSAPLKE